MDKEIKTLCMLNMPVSTICAIYPEKERIWKVPEVTIPFASSKVSL